jgi:hypothetical protein
MFYVLGHSMITVYYNRIWYFVWKQVLTYLGFLDIIETYQVIYFYTI